MRRKRSALASILLGGCLWPAVSFAQTSASPTSTLAVDQYRPSPFSDRTLRLDGTSAAPLGHYQIGLDVDYALRPLVLVDQSPGIFQAGSSGPNHDLIEHAVSGALHAGVGLGHGFEAGVVAPMTLFQKGNGAPGVAAPSVAGLGNPQVGLKAHLVSWGGLGVGATLLATIPVGAGTLTHDTTFGAGGRVLVDFRRGPLGLGLGGGFRYQADRTFYGVTLGSQVDLAAAATYRLGMRTTALVEVAGATSAKNPLADRKQSPLEALAGLRHRIGRLWLTAAAGPGLVEGIGTPVFRAVAGATWASHPPDEDGDGISDDDDRCPEVPEDRDGFEDADGCPDPDNDKDGIPDATDKCPDAAEDKDGFEDADGCPDPDNDKDGIPDATDKCPDKPETKNGFEDEDGCPDEVPPASDRDGDGILDDDDECPEEAEDKDGFEDEDGCPDLDNDKDGIPDATDKCPLEPETINGIEDEDGCPDAGPSQVRLGKDEIETLKPVFFDTDRSRVRHAFYNLLGQVALLMKAHPEIGRCGVEGHTDDTGPPDWNQKLSVLRAESVIEFLAGKGVERRRLVAIGHGEGLPWASNQTEEGRARNRRVVFHIEGVDLEGQKKESERAERRRRIRRRHPKPTSGETTERGTEAPSKTEGGGKSGEKSGEKSGGKTKTEEKTAPAKRPDGDGKPVEKAKPPEKPKGDDKALGPDKARDKPRSDKPEPTKPTGGTKGASPARSKAEEAESKPSDADSSAPDEDAPTTPARAKRLRPARRAHNKPDAPPEEPATLRELLKLPER